MENLYTTVPNRNRAKEAKFPIYIELKGESITGTLEYSNCFFVEPQKYSVQRTSSIESSSPSPWILKRTLTRVLDKDKSIHHLNELSIAGHFLKLHSGLSLDVEIERHADSITAYNHTFGIYGFGKTKEEALEDFSNAFITFYKDITNTPDIELGDSTIKFKKTLETFALLVNRG